MAEFTQQQLDSILQRALELPDEAREAFLQETCGHSAGLRAVVDRMLEACDADDSVLRPGGAMAGALWEKLCRRHTTAGLDSGERVGAYRVARTLGHGGMATVYLAERADEQFEQRVALKVLHPSKIVEETLRRFEQERQILASLDHPHIARLVDGGLTSSGQPFVAMEYVEGESIDSYCDRETLTVRQRLQLFLDVADALQYAHRNLIIHRDIKPSNILVTAQGVAKLLDFGIAKLLDASLPHAAPETRSAAHPMTAEYASPEQVRGEPLTTASDVYQLGYLLYQLLTGQRPYRVDRRNYAEVLEAICHRDPIRPSQAVMLAMTTEEGSELGPESIARARSTTPQRLRRQLRGDLDAIVLKALRKGPQDRYASAQTLIEDFCRYRAGLPVTARRGTAGYLARKFVRRHRWAVAAAAAFVILLAGYAATVTVQRERVRAALAEAEVEAQKSEQVTALLLSLFEASDPDEARGEEITARELLARGVESVEELADHPDVQARMLGVIGAIHMHLGQFETARSLLERALEIRQSVYGMEHEEVARSLNDLATLLQHQGDYDAAEPLFRRALSIRRSLLGERHEDVAASLNNLGLLLLLKGNPDAAEPLYRQALSIQRALSPPNPGAVATKLNNLAGVLREKGDLEAAEPLYREALALAQRAYGDEHPKTAMALDNLGSLLREIGDYEAAEPLARRSVVMHRKLFGDEHPDLAISLYNLATLLLLMGNLDEARADFSEALAMDKKLLGAEHPGVASDLIGLSRVHLARGEAERAEPLLRQALDIRLRVLPGENWRVADAKGWLGECLTALGRYGEAEPLLLESHTSLEASRGPGDRETRQAVDRLVTLYEAWKRPERAAAYRRAQ